ACGAPSQLETRRPNAQNAPMPLPCSTCNRLPAVGPPPFRGPRFEPRTTEPLIPGAMAHCARQIRPRILNSLRRKALLSIAFFLIPLLLAAQPGSFRFAWLSDTHVGATTGEEDLRAAVRDI